MQFIDAKTNQKSGGHKPNRRSIKHALIQGIMSYDRFAEQVVRLPWLRFIRFDKTLE